MIKSGGIEKGTGQISNPRRVSQTAGPLSNMGCRQAHSDPLHPTLPPPGLSGGGIWPVRGRTLRSKPSSLPLLTALQWTRPRVVHSSPPSKSTQTSFCHFCLVNEPACLLSPKPRSRTHRSPLPRLTCRPSCPRRMENLPSSPSEQC